MLKSDRNTIDALQNRISNEGWGKSYLSLQLENGHWGHSYYFPKWTSTHYTLLDLKNLGLPPGNPQTGIAVEMLLLECFGNDGGINYAKTVPVSDICIGGMVLNFGAYFMRHHPGLHKIIDYLLKNQLADGGWNCRNHLGDTHSSLHTTISVLEGFNQAIESGIKFKSEAVLEAAGVARQFLLKHRLYQSHRTGETIDNKMLMLSYPSRWRYDILRSLDYFRSAGANFDSRMKPAIDILLSKRRKDGRWPLQANHQGQFHFHMEKPGQPSRWNTLRALRILKYSN